MTTYRLRATLRGLKPSVTRTIAVPGDISFLDLHLILQATAGWGDRNSHRFKVGDKKIGPKGFEVSEEADEFLDQYADSKIGYDYGSFSIDLMFLKGKAQDVDFPVILDGAEDFPPEECRDLDEYMDVMEILDNPEDPSYAQVCKWMESVSEAQQAEAINKEFSEHWERMGKIEGRVPFNVGATVGALLITGCDGYFYDREKRILTEESDGTDRYVPVAFQGDSIVNTIASIYADQVGLKSDNILEDLLDDEYRQGWEDYAENFLDEITDAWADDHKFIIEPFSDSDIGKMMELFDEGNQTE